MRDSPTLPLRASVQVFLSQWFHTGSGHQPNFHPLLLSLSRFSSPSIFQISLAMDLFWETVVFCILLKLKLLRSFLLPVFCRMVKIKNHDNYYGFQKCLFFQRITYLMGKLFRTGIPLKDQNIS